VTDAERNTPSINQLQLSAENWHEHTLVAGIGFLNRGPDGVSSHFGFRRIRTWPDDASVDCARDDAHGSLSDRQTYMAVKSTSCANRPVEEA